MEHPKISEESMKSADIIWKAFEKSGKTGYYLLYKNLTKENGRDG